MMDASALTEWLVKSFADQRLDNDEKVDLRALAESMTAERKRFARNRAFDLVRDALVGQSDFAVDALRWLEQIVKTLDATDPDPAITQAHFSPGSDCRNAIIDQLHQACRTVDICIFTLSDDRITEAVLKTHHRGVAVRIITDNDKSNDEGSDVDFLKGKGVPVRFDRTPYHMHHKFALFDGQTLLNGSFNWTRSASDQNDENILLTSEKKLIDAFSGRFEEMWERFC